MMTILSYILFAVIAVASIVLGTVLATTITVLTYKQYKHTGQKRYMVFMIVADIVTSTTVLLFIRAVILSF